MTLDRPIGPSTAGPDHADSGRQGPDQIGGQNDMRHTDR